MNNRGQFSIIAALLVAIVLIGTLIAVYAMIRYDSSESITNESPQSLTATDETNLAILKALGFTVGYYGSMLQVTGNQTYAELNATAYMNNALQYIESMNPSWGETISSVNQATLHLSTDWFSNPSISTGQISVVYDLTNLGISNITYTTSCSLGVQIFKSPNSNQVCLNVTQDGTEPLTSLGQQNFAFYDYNYAASNWQLVNPSLTPIIFTNGTYLINPPSGIDESAFMVQVTDSRGIMVEASSYNSYNLDFTYGSQSMTQNSPIIVQLLQNGTMQTFGQDLVNTTQALPIPPISVKSLNLCQTGSTTDIPFQVEDWSSNYMIPLGLTSNYTIFSNSQMIVFEVTPSTSQLTLWWNGSDTATQPSAAYTDKYFTGDNPGAGTLSNGIITLNVVYNNGVFQIQTILGKVNSTASFMRINGDDSTYGSGPAYIIQYGVVRDIVQEEAEWGGGVTNCPNVYSQIVITLPANANYFTYQLRTIFINSTIARTVSDLSPLQLTTSISQPQAMTENGISNGIPIVSSSNGYFSNSTGSAHHWSELINSGEQGTGIMFTSTENQQLYAFDSMTKPHAYTGALYVNAATPTIELDPVTSAGSVSFTSPLDLTWYGAVVTFNGANPIYPPTGNSGLWSLVEQVPTVGITPQFSAAASITLSPSSGNVGTSVTVSGGGFLSNSQITITFNGGTVKTVTATAYGQIPSGTTFTVSSFPAGSYTVTATDTSFDFASAIFTLTPLDHFTVTASGGGNIGTQTAGVPFTITITAENSTGSTVTSYTGTNTLTVSSGTISPTSTGTFTAGVWTGSVTLSTSGSGITIGTAGSSKSGTSNAFTVNPGAATNFVVSGFPSPTTAGVAHSVTVTAYDAYGNIATGYAGTVKITSSDPQAVLPANAGLTNGVGTFTVTLKTAGTQSITATDTVTSSITGSQTGITVNAASASKLLVSGYPSPTTAGVSNSVTVTAEDAYGNTATSFSGTVTISSSDGKAVLPSPGTLTNGVGSFSVTLETAGTQSITASASGVTSGSQTGITVTAASFAGFTISGYPSSATAGTNFGSNVVVTAVDSYGNTVTTYTGSVYFTSTDSQAVLPYTSSSKYTFTTGTGADNGVHTFAGTGFTLKTAGSQTITVTDGNGHSATSSAITVSAAALNGFTITGYPSSVTAGSSFGSSNNVVVTAIDAYGNTVTTYTGSVYFTSTDTQAVLPYTSSSKYTFTTGSGKDNGVHSFAGTGFTLKTAGSQTVSVTDGTHSATSNAITVNPASASKLVFTSGTGQSLTAGVVSPTAIVVQRQDAYGNPVSSGTSQITVTLTTSSSGGAFYSNSGGTTKITSITIAAGSSSSAGFYYEDTVAGSPTLTGASTGLTSATTQFTINAAALSKFAFATIGSQAVGVAFSMSITAQDQYGNTVTTYSSSVGLSASTGSGTISPTSTGTTGWSSGVWTGSVTLTTTGSSVTITANDGNGHTGTSNSFTVYPPPPTLDVSSSAYTSGASSYTISLTTKANDDILYVAVSTGSHDTASVSGGSLTWTQRASVAISGSRTLQTFWALQTTKGSITITISLSGQTQSPASSAVAFAVSGANTASPFDVTSPSTSSGTNSPASTTITTAHPDFVIGIVGAKGTPTLTTGTGFTSINSATSVDPEIGAEYITEATGQTNLGVSYTLGSGSSNWAIVADAIQG